MYEPTALELKHYLIERKKTVTQYCDFSGISRLRVNRLIQKYGLPVGEIRKMPLREDLLEQLELSGTWLKTAEHYGVSPATMTRWSRRLGIHSNRGTLISETKRPTDEQLYIWYVLEKKSLYTISSMIGVDRDVLRTWMDDAEIERRPSNYREVELNAVELADDLAKGDMKYSEIARKHDISESTLMRFRKKHGFPISSK